MADKKKSRRGTTQNFLHQNPNPDQGDSLSFSVIDRIPYPAKYRYQRVDHEYEWEKYVDELDKLKRMYWEDLLTFAEIKKETGIGEWIIKDLFKEFNVSTMKHTERAKLKRERDFNLIYKLHHTDKMSLNEIYREYNFSPIYSKQVLADQGIQHLGFVNQNKDLFDDGR